jgi:hypothetical protein
VRLVRDDESDPDLGDVVVMLLVGTLAGLRDRLHDDGFDRAAEFVADLVDAGDDYLIRIVPSHRSGHV